MNLAKFRMLDLSVSLDNNPYTDPPPLLPKIDYMDHQQGWPEVAAMFPGLRKEDLPGNESWAAERLSITTHSGTHMDAPWHYASTTDGGKPAYGIDELLLEWCLKPGVKLDFRHLPDGYVVSVADVEAELRRIDHEIQPLEIVVINTRAGSLLGSLAISMRVLGWGAMPLYTSLKKGFGSLVRTHGVGMRPSSLPASASHRLGMHQLSGRATKPVVT